MTVQDDIRAKLNELTLCHGIGDADDSACTIAAINLALTGQLTDDRPDCVSPVLHGFVISLQDAVPVDMLNGDRWRAVVPLLAGTWPASDTVEKRRLELIVGWMWDRLASIRDVIPDEGRPAWDTMLTERTADAAYAARAAIYAARTATAADAVDAAAYVASATAAYATDSIAARAVIYAARVSAVDEVTFWSDADPAGLLEQLTNITEETES